jgi:hypothetical protein
MSPIVMVVVKNCWGQEYFRLRAVQTRNLGSIPGTVDVFLHPKPTTRVLGPTNPPCSGNREPFSKAYSVWRTKLTVLLKMRVRIGGPVPPLRLGLDDVQMGNCLLFTFYQVGWCNVLEACVRPIVHVISTCNSRGLPTCPQFQVKRRYSNSCML